MHLQHTLSFLLTLAYIATCGCSDVALDLAINRFDPPATIGDGAMSLDLGMKSYAEVELVSDISIDPAVETHPDISTIYGPSFTYRYGLSRHAELAVEASRGLDSPAIRFQGKYQWIGAPVTDTSARGASLSTSLAAGYVTGQFTERRLDSSHTREAEWSGESLDLAIIGGYRPASRVLFYGGPFWLNQRYGYTWRHYDTDVLVERYRTHGQATIGGVNLAAMIHARRNWRFQMEIAAARVEAERTSHYVQGFGVMATFDW